MRSTVKRHLSQAGRLGGPRGATVLIYHRVGGGSPDERDVPLADFERQVEVLSSSRTVALDDALDDLEAGLERPGVVLTFDDGFRDVHEHAWPLLREAGLPFTVYAATAYVGGTMHWEGSTAKDVGGAALHWEQLEEMVASGLCTIGNHTHRHVRPELLVDAELDRCSDELEARLGVRPRHFAYTWGIPVPRMEASLRSRFRSSVTGALGRNLPGTDLHRLRRVPVRGSDPIEFFAAKTGGSLLPERAYAGLVLAGKRLGARA